MQGISASQLTHNFSLPILILLHSRPSFYLSSLYASILKVKERCSLFLKLILKTIRKFKYLELIGTVFRLLLTWSKCWNLKYVTEELYTSGEEQRNRSRKNEEDEPKWKQHPVLDISGDESKVQCCKEQYCIRTWNVRFINQGKLDVVKQEMARVNINILGINELKWSGMGEFNSDDH